MKYKSLISIFLTATFIVSMLLPFGAFAEVESKVYLNDGFGSYITNHRSPEGYTITNLQNFSIDERGTRDKVAKFAEDGKVSIEREFTETTSKEFVVSMDIAGCGKAPSFRVLLMNGAVGTELFSVNNGALYIVANNKKITLYY